MPRKTYSPESKCEAVRLAKDSGNLSRPALELGLSLEVLRKWPDALGAHGEAAFPGHGNPPVSR